MKISIEPKDCNFIVKPDVRKVICIYRCDPNIISSIINRTPDDGIIVLTCLRDLKMKNYYTGIACCAPEDEWDEEYGKLVAFTKMKKKYCSAFFKRVNKYFDDLDTKLNRTAEMFDRIGESWNKHIDILDNRIMEKFK